MINLVLIIVGLKSGVAAFEINGDIDLDKFIFFDTESVKDSSTQLDDFVVSQSTE